MKGWGKAGTTCALRVAGTCGLKEGASQPHPGPLWLSGAPSLGSEWNPGCQRGPEDSGSALRQGPEDSGSVQARKSGLFICAIQQSSEVEQPAAHQDFNIQCLPFSLIGTYEGISENL